MCPTPTGRVHTRVTTILLGPAVVGLIITLITGHLDWIVLVGVYLTAMAVLTLIALFVSKETRDVDYENNVA